MGSHVWLRQQMRGVLLVLCLAVLLPNTNSAAIEPETIGGFSTEKRGSIANSKALLTLRNWRFQITDEQLKDNLDSEQLLNKLRQKLELEEYRNTNVSVRMTTALDAKQQNVKHSLLLLPTQQEDSSMIEEAAKLILGHVAEVCTDNSSQVLASDAQTKLQFLKDLKSYVSVVFSGNHSLTRHHADSTAQPQRHSLLGLSAVPSANTQSPTSSEEFINSIVFKKELLEALQNLLDLFEADHELWTTVSQESSQWCETESSRIMSEMQLVEAVLETLKTETLGLKSFDTKLGAQRSSLQDLTDELQENIRKLTNQIEAATSGLSSRTQTRSNRIHKVDSLRRMLMSIDAPGSGLLSSFPAQSTGMSRDTAARTCRQITGESGVYWIDLGLGPTQAFQVFCDMTTEGGGWTLLTKNLTGILATSEIKRDAVVYPPWMPDQFQEQRNEKAFEFFASRPRQKWLKYVQVQTRPSLATNYSSMALITEAVLLDLGNKLTFHDLKIKAAGANSSSECVRLDDEVAVHSSRPPPGMGPTATLLGSSAIEHVDYEAGVSRLVTSSGIATLINPAELVCGMRVGQACAGKVICDTLGLLTLSSVGTPTSVGAGEVIANVLRSDCGAICDKPLVANGEVIVFAARSEECPYGLNGDSCSGNGVCIDGMCECDYGFVGSVCEERVCVGGCGRGTCHRGVCKCEPGFTGDVCDTPIPCSRVKTTKAIAHRREPSSATDQGEVEWLGKIECNGYSYLDTCFYKCEPGFRLREISSVAIKYWKADSSVSGVAACNPNPTSVSVIPVGDCSHTFQNTMVIPDAPTAKNQLNIRWFLPLDLHSGKCSGRPHLTRVLECGSTCVKIGRAYEFGAAGDFSDVFASVSCRGTDSLTRQCLLRAESNGTQVGEWSGTQPTCVLASCPALPVPDHGNMVCSGTMESDLCHVFCNSGYQVSSAVAPVVSCVSGTWTFNATEVSDARDQWSQIKCTKIDCGKWKNVSHGTYECDTTTFGSVCALSCDDGFAPAQGASLEIRCDANGIWDGYNPNACQRQI